ncbi:hypothetical protein PoB_006279000 [Plakobranchus ocellatus]|uniref:Uncharacterized protein n=1 Tax=Plakobranchus ocellatus TaxID=259542 RepID=A0AAV4CWQ4_9GAST|nr:hypothetical protein PoB_006279000 [Plakobranchus ocellatus]
MAPAITNMQVRCQACNCMEPSQPSALSTPPMNPAYLFQCIVADYFHQRSHNYLVSVEKYIEWPIVEEAAHGAVGLVTALHRIFVTYGISDELPSDGDRFKCIIQYRNIPDRDTRLSPAMCIFGRLIRDLIPIHPGKCSPTSFGGRHSFP